jgi:hypothetical protein
MGRTCTRLLAFLFAALVLPAAARAGDSLSAGILPFDVVSVDGATDTAARALAKLIRLEMIKTNKITPQLLTAPTSRGPVSPDQAAELGKQASVNVVLVGTVMDANTTHSSHGANTGGLLNSVGVGGRVDRSTATVTLHVELIDPAKPGVADSFDVEGKASETGVGGDFSSTLGGFDSGDSAWEKTPMGKALQDAAKKVTEGLLKRSGKFGR